MSTRTGRALLALLAALAAVPVPAQEARVEASVDRRELAQDEVLRLTIRAEGSELASGLEPPPQPFDFEIVGSSQSQQSAITFQGGAVQAQHAMVWELGLAPRRAGSLVVPPFAVTIAGTRHQTTTIPVKVVAAGSRPRPAPVPAPAAPPAPGAAWRGWERDLWLEVQVDRRSPWLGQQVTASVHLVSPVGVIRVDNFKPPAYDGFWAEPLEAPSQIQPVRRVVNGIPLHSFLVQRIALFPTRSGKLVIQPFQLDVTVQVLSGNRLFDPFRSVEQVRRLSAPVELEVRPLPPGAPAGFESVNVGALSLELVPSEKSIPAGEPLALRLTARGEGNVRAWSLPTLPPIAGTRRYDPASSEAMKPADGRVAGSRTVETLIVPERSGELVIPAISWPWFDPRSGRYQLARTAELRIPVGAGRGAASPAASAAAGVELRPIRSGDGLERAALPPWRRPIFALLLLLPPAAFAGLRASDRLRQRAEADAPARRVRGAAKAARRRLAAAEKRLHAGDGPGFTAELERALTGYASDKLGRAVAGLRREELASALAAGGAPPPAVRALLTLLEDCDAARFGGAAPDGSLVERAALTMAQLEEGDWRPHAEERP